MFFIAFADPVQLLPDGKLFIHIGMILAMIWILNRTLFRPINRILESREKNKGGHSSEAEGILKEASDKKTEYSEALLDARSEGYELIEKQRSKAVDKKQDKIEAAKKEVAEMLEDENTQLETQTKEAAKEIAKEAEKMAEKISSNILNTA